MRGSPLGMTRLTGIAWDIWRAGRASQDAIARRQRGRLAALVECARSSSPYYRRLYRDVPDTVTDPVTNLGELPPVGKRELMENFDEWVTDPHITLAGLKQDLLDDPSRIGGLYRGQYLVVTSSGSTGDPSVLVHDRTSQLVASLLGPIRERRTLMTAAEARAFLHRGLRAAALIADGGHFAGVVLTEAARRRSPRIARRVRVFSVLRPLPDLVADLNDFQPTVLYGYPSAMLQLAAEQKSGRLRIHPLLAVASGESLAAHAGGGHRGGPRLPGHCAVPCLGGPRTDQPLPAGAASCQRGLEHRGAGGRRLPSRAGRGTLPHGAGHQPGQRGPAADPVQPGRPGAAGCRAVRLRQSVPTLRVEGRSGDVLSFGAAEGAEFDSAGLDGAGLDGAVVTVLPLALGTVIEETAGVRRFQAIRTGLRSITVRLELWPGAEPGAVQAATRDRLGAFFAAQGADGVDVRFAEEPPRPDRSGKFRQVWSA